MQLSADTSGLQLTSLWRHSLDVWLQQKRNILALRRSSRAVLLPEKHRRNMLDRAYGVISHIDVARRAAVRKIICCHRPSSYHLSTACER